MVIVENRHTYKGDGIYIGQGTIWGNKASHKNYKGVEVLCESREESIAWYKNWLKEQYKTNPYLRHELVKLARRHKNGEKIVLICSCKPLPCHGDVLKAAIEAIAKAL
jgi:hypothetical protein